MPSNPLDANKTCVRRQFEELWNNGQLASHGVTVTCV